jgi:DNA-binding LacI/PurR family transcriptional regulator
VKRATIKDVARVAGVSTATVSFVLNNNRREAITEVVRRRVLEAARELNYHPSAAAAALARRRMRNVALVFYKTDDAITNHFYSFVVQGAIKEAIERDYNLLFSYVDATYTGYQVLPKIVREKNAEGVIFMRRVEPRMVRDIQALGIPVVVVDAFPRLPGVNALQIDNRRGGKLAAEHLFELGHRDIAMLLPREAVPSIAERLEGFQSAFEQHDLKFVRRTHVVLADAFNFHAGYEGTRRALEQAKLTGLFCANDEMAAGALRAAHEAGRDVPGSLSVVGFDNITMSNYVDPPLTTIGVVKEHMGRRAMTRLIEILEGGDTRVQTEIAPVELIARGSSGKPRERPSSPRARSRRR